MSDSATDSSIAHVNVPRNTIIAVISPYMVNTDKGDLKSNVFWIWGELLRVQHAVLTNLCPFRIIVHFRFHLCLLSSARNKGPLFLFSSSLHCD